MHTLYICESEIITTVRVNINISQIGDIRKLSATDFWNISIITDQGDNHYEVVKQTPENIVFYSENVDRSSRRTRLIFVVGKNGSGSLK